MDAKRALTDGTFCPMPWTGLMYNFDGSVRNCIRNEGFIGNIKYNTIEEILQGPVNIATQTAILDSKPGPTCYPCYNLERNKKGFSIISDRIFYIRELKSVPFTTYQLGNHDLQAIDVRWTNLCNFACVYCDEKFSSKWASELNIVQEQPTAQQVDAFKSYIFKRAANLKHVYMAGGEPLLMKQNLELLELLKKVNPDVNLRINTNLSKVDTQVFETVCSFPNVHWTISVESLGVEYEYIRYGGTWAGFLENLLTIQKLNHKVSFNMLHFILNYRSIFDCIDFLKEIGFHNNSFIAGSLLGPLYLNIRHLPEHVLHSIKDILIARINEKPGYLLEDSYRNLLHYITQPFEKNLTQTLQKLQELDNRRNINSKEIFTELYSLT
jgi:uncharacterized Fe-S cluster-containing radical SAM superfamily protein